MTDEQFWAALEEKTKEVEELEDHPALVSKITAILLFAYSAESTTPKARIVKNFVMAVSLKLMPVGAAILHSATMEAIDNFSLYDPE